MAGLEAERGAPAEQLDAVLAGAGIEARTRCADIAAAYTQACDMATENDRIVAFGSFYTVASVMRARRAAG
jgi:dihydrofolate synthase/folylpolyglutamate synthase